MTWSPSHRRFAAARAVLVAGLVLALQACAAAPSAECPDLDVVCPNLSCDAYELNSAGCRMCACVAPPPAPVCWDASDCAADQRCDLVNYCERAPGCDEDGPCPDACYGRCVETPRACSDGSGCPDGQTCALLDGARPGGPAAGAGEAAPPPPPGVCVDAACATDIELPPCPPGTAPIFDPAIDACRATCAPADPCRQLLPEQCAASPGCTIIDEPCACAGDACDACADTRRCASVDDCGRRTPETCEANPNCILKPVAGPPPDGSGCDQGSATCDDGAPPPPPRYMPVCVPRSIDGTCVTDGECRVGEVCKVSTVCATGCETDATGAEQCFQECWTERGACAPSDAACSSLDPASCEADPRCTVRDAASGSCSCDDVPFPCTCPEEEPVCQPVTSLCTTDEECPAGQSCFVTEACAPCDPSTGEDVGCVAPCFLEGRCVDGAAPPAPCAEDADCERGFTCVEATVCEACRPTEDADEEGTSFDSCSAACRSGAVCQETTSCAQDDDCPEDSACDLLTGMCIRAPAADGLCRADADCTAGQRCATELDVCFQSPAGPGCWSSCVAAPESDAAASTTIYCLEDEACGAGESCVFSSAVCLVDPGSIFQACSGWCASGCVELPTPARDPLTAACVVFSSTCIPPGWIPTTGC